MSDISQREREVLGLAAALVAANIGKRLRVKLEAHGRADAMELGMLASIVAIPVIQTFLIEDNPWAAMDEVDRLEELLKEGE